MIIIVGACLRAFLWGNENRLLSFFILAALMASSIFMICYVRKLQEYAKEKERCFIQEEAKRKHAENILKQNEERYKTFIEQSSEAIWRFETQGGYMIPICASEEKIIDEIYEYSYLAECNDAMAQIYGFSTASEIIGIKLSHIMPSSDPHNIEFLRTFITSGFKLNDAEAHKIDKNGNPKHILTNFFGVIENGYLIRAWGTQRDITMLRQSENDMKKALEKAEAANSAKSEFLANMSHEIRTPMNAVVGIASILGRHMNISAERQRELIDTLQLSAKALMTLIDDLLDIAKIEDAKLQLENNTFDLEQLAKNVVTILDIKAKEKGIKLTLSHNAQLRGKYVGDTNRIQQVLMNLVSNAIKFTDKGEVKVSIIPHLNEITYRKDACIEITDTGIGIAEGQLEAIFNKFSQADTSITRNYGGTGLGLAITKMLIELMGGKIEVESKVGYGSTFRVYLPLAKLNNIEKLCNESKIGKDEQEHALAQDITERPYILLVEDYQPNILVATSILSELGYCYEIAKNGREAINKLISRRFSLVLMDVRMPMIDGYQATQIIRRNEKEKGLPHIPVIGVTAHALHEDREKCLAAGMNDYISKPYSLQELQEKISALSPTIAPSLLEPSI